MAQTPNNITLMEESEGDKPAAVNVALRDVDREITALKTAAPNAGASARRLALHVLEGADAVTDVTGGTWTNLGAGHAFDVSAAGSAVEFIVAGAASIRRPSTNNNGDVGSRLVIDGGSPNERRVRVGGDFKDQNTTGDTFSNPLTGSGVVIAQGLGVGSHTLQLQVWCGENYTLLFQPVAFPNSYFCEINVWENA